MNPAARNPIVAQALSILACQVRESDALASPDAARDFVRLRLGDRPREVVIEALACRAAAVILCHNHPSGSAEPSRADELLTQTLKQALALVDVRVLDHFIVTRTSVLSFAERGLL